jgi:hypothetical protein
LVTAQDLKGAVKFREGFNSRIIVNEPANQIILGAGVGLGAGDPCNDTRIDSSGVFGSENCQGCREFIATVNGLGADSRRLTIAGDRGIEIEKVGPHKLRVRVDLQKICEVS